jgi:DNA-binding MarR family transcriptional regulator
MSSEAVTAVRNLRGLSLAEKCILMMLADHRNWKTGKCFPSAKLLQEESGASSKTFWKAMKSLEAKGYVSRVSGAKGRSNSYELHLEGLKPIEAVVEPTLDVAATGEPAAPKPKPQLVYSKEYDLAFDVRVAADSKTKVSTPKDVELMTKLVAKYSLESVTMVVEYLSTNLTWQKAIKTAGQPVSWFTSDKVFPKIANSARMATKAVPTTFVIEDDDEELV